MLVTFEKSPHILITNAAVLSRVSQASDGLTRDLHRHKYEEYYT